MNAKQIKKRMRIMLISMGILFGSILIYKVVGGLLLKHYMATHSNVVSVSTAKVGYAAWDSRLSASGSLRAIRGVGVTTEMAGMVQSIYFTPGAAVKEGEVLVQLNADNDIALLHSLQANAELANSTYLRDQAQLAVKAISKQTLDIDSANLKSLHAQVDQQAAIVAKKTIKAPFAGRLGVNLVSPGQYVNPGTEIVMLQTLDPIYVDFYVPQQALSQLTVGMSVVITADTYPGQTFTGKITTINPAVDTSTRNVEIEATIANPKYELTPGMFTSVEVITAQPQRYLTLPQTAISFNSYGEVVYVVKSGEKDDSLVATQTFVTTGETRGDQVTILSGLKEDETVVTSGQLKLKNGSAITVNNSVTPPNNPTPQVPDDH